MIVEAVTTTVPTADEEIVRSVIAAQGYSAHGLGVVFHDIVGNPRVLVTGGSRIQGSTRRLIQALHREGVPVSLPRCELCGATEKTFVRRLTSGGAACSSCARWMSLTRCTGCGRVAPRGGSNPQGKPLCETCVDQRPLRSCDECGRSRRIHVRTADQRGLCSSCSNRDPDRWETCTDCGHRAPVASRSQAGPRCPRCHQKPKHPCDRCGRLAPVHSRKSREQVCGPCYHLPQALCGRCGHPRVHRDDQTTPSCPRCGSARIRSCGRCHGVTFRFGVGRDGQHACLHCWLRTRILAIVADKDGVVMPELIPFVDDLAAVDDTARMVRWITQGKARSVLEGMAHGRLPLCHESLDAASGERRGRAIAIEHLRRLLVASGVLPHRDEHLSRLERTIPDYLAKTHPDDQKILRPFATWHVLAEARRRVARGRPSHGVCLGSRALLMVAINLMTWLRENDVDLQAIPPSRVEEWLRQHPGRTVHTGTFLRWTHQRGLTSKVELDTQLEWGPTTFLDQQQQWATARRCLHDAAMPVVDRLVVGLVLLYGQQIRTIANLRRTDVQTKAGTTTLRLGVEAVELLEPLAGLARALADGSVKDRWTGGTARTYPVPNQWLIPGRGPDKPLGTHALQRRIAKYGITARAARNTAMLSLSRDVPTAVLADLLGVTAATAERWRQLSGGSWTAYAPQGGYRRAYRSDVEG